MRPVNPEPDAPPKPAGKLTVIVKSIQSAHTDALASAVRDICRRDEERQANA
jgi:hypothetical protein